MPPGSRVALGCSFLLADDWDWGLDDLPDAWCANWRVTEVLKRPHRHPLSDYVIFVGPLEQRAF